MQQTASGVQASIANVFKQIQAESRRRIIEDTTIRKSLANVFCLLGLLGGRTLCSKQQRLHLISRRVNESPD